MIIYNFCHIHHRKNCEHLFRPTYGNFINVTLYENPPVEPEPEEEEPSKFLVYLSDEFEKLQLRIEELEAENLKLKERLDVKANDMVLVKRTLTPKARKNLTAKK